MGVNDLLPALLQPPLSSTNACVCSLNGLMRDILLVVELDYLLDSEVFYFQPCLYPMKYLHPRGMYTLPCREVQRGGTPSAGK